MIAAKEVGGGRKKKVDYVEQRFRITKTTTFGDLLEVACRFWALDEKKFKLYDENFHDLMSLNFEKSHPAHMVEKYFKLIMVKNQPTLHLMKPDLENTVVLP